MPVRKTTALTDDQMEGYVPIFPDYSDFETANTQFENARTVEEQLEAVSAMESYLDGAHDNASNLEKILTRARESTAAVVIDELSLGLKRAKERMTHLEKPYYDVTTDDRDRLLGLLVEFNKLVTTLL